MSQCTAKKRRGRTKTPPRRVKSEQIFAISTMIPIWTGSRIAYGTSPEYQRSIGGSHGTPKNATIAWPATRSTNSASRIQSSAAKSPMLLGEVHALVVPVPLALVELLRVVLAFQLQEFRHLREARVDLAAQRIAVVRRVV